MNGLPRTRRTRSAHYRIDADHSNAHTVWKSLESPQDPTDEELTAIKARQGLEALAEPQDVSVTEGTLALQRESAAALGLVAGSDAAMSGIADVTLDNGVTIHRFR